MEINWGIYGLPQAGLIAQKLLDKQLNNKEYQHIEITPGFWTHDWRPICFSLCVNDLGLKYVGKEHAEHLMPVLREHYRILSGWKGKRYLGMDLNWEYENHKVHPSMMGYVVEALTIL